MSQLSVIHGIPGLVQFVWESREPFSEEEAYKKSDKYFGKVTHIFGYTLVDDGLQDPTYYWYAEVV